MKVLHVVHSLEPGGLENGIVNIARGLCSRGIETHVACLERRGAFAERLPAPELVTVLGKGHGFSLATAWRLARLIAKTQPDIIHSHNLGPLIYTGLAQFMGRRRPLLHGEHGQLTDEERTPRRLRQRRWLYRACHAIHTVSSGLRDELVALDFPAQKIAVIANGVDTTHFVPGDRQAARRSLRLPEDATFVGLVGRFGAFKRHSTLLAAFENIADRFPRLHLLFAGSGGPEEARIAASVAASPHRLRLHLIGFQSDPLRSYQAFDLLAIPSVNEGLSNAALEAMACALPVLANVGCGHEQLITSGRDGLIADVRTPDALATQLAALLAAPAQLVDLGRNARTKVESQFSLDRMLTEYERCYCSLAGA